MRFRPVGRTRPWFPLRAAAAVALLSLPLRADEAGPRRGDPAARLSSAPQASELWNFTARFDTGYRLFAWFFITNEGPGERSAAALWYLVHPDGRVDEFRNGRRQGHWTLSPDRRRIRIASSVLELDQSMYRVALDSTSQRVTIDLRVAAAERPPWPAPSSPPTAALRTDTLQVSTPVEGTIWLGGMGAPMAVRGTAALTHAWMDESVPSLVQRRIEFVVERPDLAFYLTDITTPAGDDQRWVALARTDGGAYQSADLEVTLGPPALTADRRYPIPGRLVVRNGRLTLDIQPQRLLLRANPLDVVPQPFRFLFSLKIAPQWVWVDASFRLQLAGGGDEAPLEAEGRGLLALNYVNPLPRPQ